MTVSKTTNPIKKLTKRERRVLIVALIIVPFFYPFLIVWFAHPQLERVYRNALRLPGYLRAIAPPDGKCPSDLAALKESALSGSYLCVVPKAREDTLKSLRIIEDLNLPLIGRGVDVWSSVGDAYEILSFIETDTEKECQHAGEKLHQAAANLEKALARYEQTRTLTWVLLYVWLVAEVFGWIVVIYFARRFWRKRAEAKGLSQ
jgi:hypothetical protein